MGPVLGEYSLPKRNSSQNGGLWLLSLIQELSQGKGQVRLVKLLDCSDCDWDKQYPPTDTQSPKLQETQNRLHSSASSCPLLSTHIHTLTVSEGLFSFPPTSTKFLTRGKTLFKLSNMEGKSLSPSFAGSYHSGINCQAYSPPGHLGKGPHTIRLFSHMKDFPVRHTLFEIHWIQYSSENISSFSASELG